MIARTLAIALLLISGAGAQVPMTGGGKGTPASGGYVGPGDVVPGAAAFWGLRGYRSSYVGPVANICDLATGGVCADATWAAGVLTLPLIGGVPCDNNFSKCQVKTLYDQSGALACDGAVACDLTQTASSRRPTLVLPGGAGCSSNTSYCMIHVRASQQCFRTTVGYTHTQPVSGVFVATRNGNTNAVQNVLALGGVVTVGYAAALNTLSVTAGTPQTISAADNAWHAVQAVWSNTVGSLSADGATTSANNGTGAPSASSLVWGSTSVICPLATTFDGVAAEAGIWPVAFSAQNIADLNTNQRAYWGF